MKLLRVKQVTDMIGFSRSEIYRLLSLGRFPVQIRIGERAVAWRSDEIQRWIDERVAARDDTTRLAAQHTPVRK